MSVKKKMKVELEMRFASCGIHVSAKVLLVTALPPCSLLCMFLSFFSSGGHESETGQQPKEESQ